MARDQIEVMRRLGHSRFGVAGHDRGGRCAYRLAIDHPDRVTKLAVLDIVPTADVLRRVDLDVARGIWVWLLLSQPYDVPERIVGAAPQAFVDHMLDTWSGKDARFPPAVSAAYVEAFRDPATVHAICEEYRASIGIDRELDEADREARPIRCPVLSLWSRDGLLRAWGDVLAVWREWAADVRGRPLDWGHFLAEEAPDETAAELRAFFSS